MRRKNKKFYLDLAWAQHDLCYDRSLNFIKVYEAYNLQAGDYGSKSWKEAFDLDRSSLSIANDYALASQIACERAGLC